MIILLGYGDTVTHASNDGEKTLCGLSTGGMEILDVQQMILHASIQELSKCEQCKVEARRK